MKWWLSRRVDEHFIFLSLSLLKKKSKKYFSLKYKYCLLSFCAQILYFVYIYILQLTIETNSPPRNLPFLLLMRSFPRSPPMRSTMAQSLTTLGDVTDWSTHSTYYSIFCLIRLLLADLTEFFCETLWSYLGLTSIFFAAFNLVTIILVFALCRHFDDCRRHCYMTMNTL